MWAVLRLPLAEARAGLRRGAAQPPSVEDTESEEDDLCGYRDVCTLPIISFVDQNCLDCGDGCGRAWRNSHQDHELDECAFALPQDPAPKCTSDPSKIPHSNQR